MSPGAGEERRARPGPHIRRGLPRVVQSGEKSQGSVHGSQALSTQILRTLGCSLKAVIWFCFIFAYDSSKAENKVTRVFECVGF